MKKQKFKVGDKVQLERSYCRWVVDHLVESYFTPDGVFRGDELQVTAVLGALSEPPVPLTGIIAKLGEDELGVPTAYATFHSKHGVYVSWVRFSDLTKIVKKKKVR